MSYDEPVVQKVTCQGDSCGCQKAGSARLAQPLVNDGVGRSLVVKGAERGWPFFVIFPAISLAISQQ